MTAAIGAKIVIDLAFHVGSVHVYRRWIGDAGQASLGAGLLAALAEPFSFQLLAPRRRRARLGGLPDWTAKLGRQSRFGVASTPGAAPGTGEPPA
ncbi:MAG: hypothetical protein ABI641_12610 [Caldimonas sp.]